VTITPNEPGQGQFLNAYEQELAGLAGIGGINGIPIATDSLVYMGPDYVVPGRRQPKRGIVGGSNGMFTTDEAMKLWLTFDPQQTKRFDDAYERYTGTRPQGASGLAAWQQMVGQAGILSKALGRPVDPFETVELLADRSPAKERAGSGGPTTTFSRTESVNLTEPGQARSFLDSALGGYLGRMPTQKEYASFLKALNMGQEESPTITEQTVRSSGGGSTQTVRSNVKTTGGFDERQFATEYAKSRPEYAETQLSTTGLQAFLDLLK
jgi:hypothetical protein